MLFLKRCSISKLLCKQKSEKDNTLYVLPVLLFGWFVGSFIITYSIAVYYKHVTPILPFVSDTGTRYPENAIFGQLLNVGSVIMAVSIYVRYLQVKTILQVNKLGNIGKLLNLTCLWLGLLIAVGISIVANFQLSVAFTIHLIGTGFAIGFGVLFQVIQVVLCVYIYPHLGSKCVNNSRILIVFTSCICLGYCVPPYLSGLTNVGNQDRSIENEKDDYVYILLNATTEWMIIVLTMVFISTFVYEFRRTTFQEIKVEISEPAVNLF